MNKNETNTTLGSNAIAVMCVHAISILNGIKDTRYFSLKGVIKSDTGYLVHLKSLSPNFTYEEAGGLDNTTLLIDNAEYRAYYENQWIELIKI